MIENRNIVDTLFNFMNIKGVGPVQTNKLLLSLRSGLATVSLFEYAKSLLNDTQQLEFEQKKYHNIEITPKFHVNFISIQDEDYPKALKDCLKASTPPILSMIGNVDVLKGKSVAFSGSRNVSDKGIKITTDCTEQLVDQNFTIVSGYAKGVDFAAHYAALKNGGSTIIVLPEGINHFRIKKELKEVWDWERVLVISEFQPHEKWMASRAMKRNTTIIGLSEVVVVVEAGITGGSFDAGEKTLQFGKILFVPQYNVIPESAVGNNILLNRGAFPIKMSKETLKPNLTKMLEVLEEKNKYLLFH
ncbi:MAG: DNA-processing protein DprA [Pseudosphingobacterium sp.]|nr:DNA-processing protein DprA [Pseudosphingobacterium sp.]